MLRAADVLIAEVNEYRQEMNETQSMCFFSCNLPLDRAIFILESEEYKNNTFELHYR